MRDAADVFFHSALDIKDSLGHHPNIYTRSRTVQNLFMIPPPRRAGDSVNLLQAGSGT